MLFPFLFGGAENFKDVYGMLELSSAEEYQHPEYPNWIALCLLDIPAMTVPKVLLQFLHPEKEEIMAIRIYRHYLSPEKYLGLLFFSTLETAMSVKDNLCNKQSNVLWSDEPQLYFVNGISIQTFHDHVQLADFSFLLDHEFHDSNFNSSRNLLPPYHQEESKQDCPLCLENISRNNPHTVILYCSHQFHFDCLIRINNSQCPVCRFDHGNVLQKNSICNTCGFAHKRQPVVPNTLPPKSLSQDFDLDIWVCLTCGYSGCGEHGANHIYQHYQETSHNYVMNTQFRHKIYDFVRDNFVHRLILMDSSVTSHIESNLESAKFIEKCDSEMMINEDEQLIVGSKLEDLARQYQQLLVWRMNQSRIFYNQKLNQIWSAVTEDTNAFDTSNKKDIEQLVPWTNGKISFDKNLTWTKCIKSSLNLEHSKLSRQADVMKEKLTRLRKEKEILEVLHKQLLLNKRDLSIQLENESAQVLEAQQFGSAEIQLLEGKVNNLMLKVGCEEKLPTPHPNSSSSSRRNVRERENNSNVGSD